MQDYNNFNASGGYPQRHGTYYQPQFQQQYQPAPQQQYYNQINSERAHEKNEIFTAGLALGAVLIANLFIQVFGGVLIRTSGHYDLFLNSFLYQNSINILLVDLAAIIVPFGLMALILKKRYVTPVVPLEKTGFVKGAAWVFVGLTFCLFANILTSGVIELVKGWGYEMTKTDTLKPTNALDCVILVFSTAVAPALCEEFAMRCCSIGLLRKHGKAFAVVAVSIVFGLLHGNAIQFIFAMTIGLILGYITIATDSVLPAIFIHALNNGMSVAQSIATLAGGANASKTVTLIITTAFFAGGVVGIIYLLITKQLLPKKEIAPPKPYKINFFVKLALLIPGLFVPFVILIFVTSKTIVPIS